MKELCNRLMAIDSGPDAHKDFGGIAFLWFIVESELLKKKKIQILDFCVFLFRFYCDNLILRQKHHSKLINNILLCKPSDLFGNTIETLSFVKERTNLIDFDNECIYWKYKETDFSDDDFKTLMQVICFLSQKYTNVNNFTYNSSLNVEDFNNYQNAIPGSKLFNRLLERINYCYICNSSNINSLKIVKLNSSYNSYDINNYLLLCDEHAKKYMNRKLSILEDGRAVIDGKIVESRLEINVLKYIRKALRHKED